MYQFDSLFAGLTSLGIGNGVLFALYLLHQARREGQFSNRYLGWFMLVLSSRFALTALHYFYRTPDADFAHLGLGLNLALGPFFLAYVYTLFKEPLSKGFWFTHLWPALLVPPTVWSLHTFVELEILAPFQSGWFVFNQVTLLHAVLYWVFSYRWGKIKLEERAQRGIGIDPMHNWLRGLLIFLSVLTLAYSFNNAKILCVIFCPLFYTIIVYLILAYFMRHYALFQKGDGWDAPKTMVLKTEKAGELKSQLLAFMTEQEGFLDAALSLDKLAKQLGVSTHQLSHYINTQEGCNFADWVNRYRVLHACKLLQHPKYAHLKIAAIAHESGFNTLSVFNGAFKRMMGCTPSLFKKQSLGL
jgi:AraC-like DNA-binding protein